MQPLTDKQQATLDFVRVYVRENGAPPTIKEISQGMGWNSPNAAVSHIEALERKGWLKQRRGVSRGIVLTSAGYEESANRILEIMRQAFSEGWTEEKVKAAVLVEVNEAVKLAAGTGG